MPRRYPPEETFARIAAWCDKQERCTKELKEKLLKWEIPNDEINSLIRSLTQRGFVDDLRFASAYASDRMRFRNWGVLKVKAALRQKGVDASTIQKALNQLDEHLASDAIQQALEAALRRGHQVSDYRSKMKLARHLAAKGFEPEKIFKLLDAYNFD